jgi:ADYC domain
MPGKFTFACENGAIAKCIGWGYKPWAKKDGHSLADLHQACTRMARADYCGDGRSHTREDNPIDMYDGLAVLTRATEASAGWEPARASFEAAWSPQGALCLARTRDGQAVDAVMAECPGRFEAVAKDLGEGDRCTVLRKGASAEAALLRNHSYGKGGQAPAKAAAP